MASKNITITEEAYERLVEYKRETRVSRTPSSDSPVGNVT